MLPIYEIEKRLLEALGRESRVILEAPTGSGKSTQVPQMLARGGFLDAGEAVVLQPRRMAARLLARRVAEEMGERLGGFVGYQIRHENATSKATRIRFVTEGVLLRRLIGDPLLRGVSVVVLDEFHERSLHADLSLARVRQLQESGRPDLKAIVMSATLEADDLKRYLEPCAAIRSEGRMHPVDTRYLEPKEARGKEAIWDLAARSAEQALEETKDGHVLVFMPGAREIGRTLRALGERLSSERYALLALHGGLSDAAQDRALGRSDRRKVIVATNVAETSLTIEGARVVIDSGQARVARYDPVRGVDTLWIEKIGDASARQREGRAGREAPGVCRRLWTRRDHESRAFREEPEIKRVDLSEAVLALLASGVGDLAAFPWFEPPEEERLDEALELLRFLGAIDERNALTERGRRLSGFPLHPRHASMLLAASDLGCARELCLVAAAVQTRSLWSAKIDKATLERRRELVGEGLDSDFLALARAWEEADRRGFDRRFCEEAGIHAHSARQIGQAARQIGQAALQQGLNLEKRSEDLRGALGRCLLLGFPDRVCRRLDRGTLRCEMVGGKRGKLARESLAGEAELLLAGEAAEIGRQGGEATLLFSQCAAIDRAWLEELYPDRFSAGEETRYDPRQKRVVRRRYARFADLDLEVDEFFEVEEAEAARVLAGLVQEGKAKLDRWDGEVEELVARFNLAARVWPEYGLEPIDAAARALIWEQSCLGARSLRDLKRQEVLPVIREWIGPEALALVERAAPLRLKLPSGRSARARYAGEERPVLSARIQDLYGATDADLVLLEGRVAPLVELLAPNQRPVQLTDSLDRFWEGAYPEIRKQLKGRYPKHEWR